MPDVSNKRPRDDDTTNTHRKSLKIDGLEEFKAAVYAIYGMEYLDEMYLVWELACDINPSDPLTAFVPIGVDRIVGPFEILGALTFNKGSNPHLHWRYFYDPPEFGTLMISVDRHWGYFRDDPRQLPLFVASGTSNDYQFQIEGDTLLGTIHSIALKSTSGSSNKSILEMIEAKMRLHGINPVDSKRTSAWRHKQSIGHPFHGLGMVVPFDKKSQVGYRELPMSVAEFKRLLEKVSKGTATSAEKSSYESTLTFADVANDECDFGHSLEVGLDLFCFAGAQPTCNLHRNSVRLMDTAYMLLNRKLFQKIITNHMERRDRRVLSEKMS